jgi:RNA polymerase sigma-70 factor (ECF subfamily)
MAHPNVITSLQATVQATKDTQSIHREDPDLPTILQCLQGDTKAFEVIVTRYQSKIFHIAYRYLGNLDEAQETTQEIFINIYKHLKSFRQDCLFATWVYRIAMNFCNNRLKYLKRRHYYTTISNNPIKPDDDDAVHWEIADTGLLADELLDREEIHQFIEQGMATLPAELKETLILRDVDGCSYADMVNILGIAEGTVKSRLHRARNELKNLVSAMLAKAGRAKRKQHHEA